MNGDFDKLDLKSVTHYGMHKLLLFEGNYKYYIDRKDALAGDSFPIGEVMIAWFAKWYNSEGYL